MVRDTPPSQDAFPPQIWNSYLKEYRRYAPDSKQFLETRSEVKVNVTGTQDGARHFVIPRCINIPNLGFLPQII